MEDSLVILESGLEFCVCVCLFAQLCPTHCDPMDCSPPGSSVHGILQARILCISIVEGSSRARCVCKDY